MKKFLSLLICALLLFPFAPAAEASYRSEAEAIIAHKTAAAGAGSTQEWIFSLADTAGTCAEWYVIALARLGYGGFESYAQALADYLGEKTVRGTNAQRCALGFIAAGCKSEYIEETAKNSIGSQGIMSYVWGLMLLSCGAEGEYAPEALAIELASMRTADGGFALSGDSANPDVTAMALTVLAPYREIAEVSEAIDGALLCLSAMQTASGGYISYGAENCESAAQVVVALCSLGIDPERDARLTKNGKSALDSVRSFALTGGGYAHVAGGEENEMATVQALHAFAAMHLFENGESLFGFEMPAGVPDGFYDVGAEKPNENGEKAPVNIKNAVCITIIAACAVGIVITALVPTKKKEDEKRAG